MIGQDGGGSSKILNPHKGRKRRKEKEEEV